MDLDNRAIERHCLHFNSHNLSTLQFLKHSLDDPAFTPPIHPRIDGVPFPKVRGQPPPFAPLLGHLQDRVEHLQVFVLHVSPLLGKAFRDLFILFLCEFHSPLFQLFTKVSISVNTP